MDPEGNVRLALSEAEDVSSRQKFNFDLGMSVENVSITAGETQAQTSRATIYASYLPVFARRLPDAVPRPGRLPPCARTWGRLGCPPSVSTLPSVVRWNRVWPVAASRACSLRLTVRSPIFGGRSTARGVPLLAAVRKIRTSPYFSSAPPSLPSGPKPRTTAVGRLQR